MPPGCCFLSLREDAGGVQQGFGGNAAAQQAGSAKPGVGFDERASARSAVGGDFAFSDFHAAMNVREIDGAVGVFFGDGEGKGLLALLVINSGFHDDERDVVRWVSKSALRTE